ncbi:MAG: hypothetical protein KAQ91_02300 [Methylococcales bacterium]|nr:hypothetical protein [Methylococcales bacterium]
MTYVRRNKKGEIVEIHKTQEKESDQWIEPADPEVLAFLQGVETTAQAKKALTITDHEMVRVIEDLIDLLMDKQVFIFTELPEAVQSKLNARRKLRKDINSLEDLIKEDDEFF